MSGVWFTSDTHIGHDLVAAHRGYGRAERMAFIMGQRWDRLVQDGDEVWVLGDVVMGMDREAGLDWFAQRRGIKHLVLGNHDRAHPLNNNAHAHIAIYARVFETVQTFATVPLGEGVRARLSHFPYAGDRGAERFSEWRLRDAGKVLLHGHTHLPERISYTPLGTLQVHVGMDAWGLRPVSRHDLYQLVLQHRDKGVVSAETGKV